jgi:hypothetical protein
MKENENDKYNGKTVDVQELEVVNMVKIYTQPKVIYRFNAVPIKIPMIFLIKVKKNIKCQCNRYGLGVWVPLGCEYPRFLVN